MVDYNMFIFVAYCITMAGLSAANVNELKGLGNISYYNTVILVISITFAIMLMTWYFAGEGKCDSSAGGAIRGIQNDTRQTIGQLIAILLILTNVVLSGISSFGSSELSLISEKAQSIVRSQFGVSVGLFAMFLISKFYLWLS